MNAAHLHLVFNHLPIIIPMIGLLVMIGGVMFRSSIVKRTSYVIFILGAVCTMPALFTGDGAEEILEALPGIEKSMIHDHEEIAETFALLSYLLGMVSLIGLWASVKKKSFSSYFPLTTILLSILVLYFAQQTGRTGGAILHAEIRESN